MKTLRMLLLSAALGSAVAACGTGNGAGSQRRPTASPTAFVLQEWSITAPTTQLHAGNVVVTATNRGSETHELVIVRADDMTSLASPLTCHGVSWVLGRVRTRMSPDRRLTW